MAPVIVRIVLMAATQVPQEQQLALFVPMAATQVPQDHRLALMSQMVILVLLAHTAPIVASRA